MTLLALLLATGVGYGIAAIAVRFNLLPRRKQRADGRSSRRLPPVQADEGAAAGEGTSWTALDELQLMRLLRDSAS